MNGILMFALFTAAVGLPAFPAEHEDRTAYEVVAFGDSWAYLAAPAIQRQFSKRLRFDIRVANKGVPGSTAEQWATNSSYLPSVVSDETKIVWLSISGNDVMQNYIKNQTEGMWDRIDKNVRVIISSLHSVRPDIKVVMSGYDLVNFVQSKDCIATAITIFHGLGQDEINRIFIRIGDVQNAIANSMPNVSYVSLWGTLQSQAKSGVPPPYPDVLFPSPAKYFADCIHCNTEGYDILMNKVYEQSLKDL